MFNDIDNNDYKNKPENGNNNEYNLECPELVNIIPVINNTNNTNNTQTTSSPPKYNDIIDVIITEPEPQHIPETIPIDTLYIDEQTPNILYNVLHVVDNIIAYGRTVIENNYFNFADNNDFNLVYPNIYIGNYSTTTNLELLQNIGITHIVSVISQFNPPFPKLFTYLHCYAYDDQSQDISQYFNNSNAFIANALLNSGKILIHCMAGRSRSVTMFLAFIIHILQNKFSQSNINMDTYNDVSNEIEYNNITNLIANTKAGFSKSRAQNAGFSKSRAQNIIENDNNAGFSKSRAQNIIENENENYNNDNNNNNKLLLNKPLPIYTPVENITTQSYQLPQLSNKYNNFILYKKEQMINEVNVLIANYNIFIKNYKMYDNANALEVMEYTTITKHKHDIKSGFIQLLINYIKKYRLIAQPNPYFIIQLKHYLIL